MKTIWTARECTGKRNTNYYTQNKLANTAKYTNLPIEQKVEANYKLENNNKYKAQNKNKKQNPD